MSILAYQSYESDMTGDTDVAVVGDFIGAASSNVPYFFDEWCPHCKRQCHIVNFPTLSESPFENLAACSRCGWWSWRSGEWSDTNWFTAVQSAKAILSRFAFDSDSVPYCALSEYLTKHPYHLQKISPKKCEELVAAVFRDALGYGIESCSYCGHDLGIDVVAIRADLPYPVAIQIKRYSRPVELALIHQFCGAMIDSEFRKGYFITTGSYRSGCYGVTRRLKMRSQIEIDLIDGRHFLEFLGILNDKHAQQVYCPLWGSVVERRSAAPGDPRCWISLPSNEKKKHSNKMEERKGG